MRSFCLFVSILILFMSCTKQRIDAEVNDFFYFTNDGSDMPVWVEGSTISKTMIVLLHGGPGGSSQYYNNVLNSFTSPLENDYLMVYYDQRGAGTSQGHYSKSDLTLEQFNDDLDKLITLLKYKYEVDYLILMGHSWGGLLGTSYLLDGKNNDRVNGWIEIDGAHNWFPFPDLYNTFDSIANQQILLNNSVSFWNDVVGEINKVSDKNNPTKLEVSKINSLGFDAEVVLTDDNQIERGIVYKDDVKYHNLFSGYNAITADVNLLVTSSVLGMFNYLYDNKFNFTPRVNEITIPVMLNWGEFDLIVPKSIAIDTYDNLGTPIDKKEGYIYKVSGHSPMINQPQIMVENIKLFIEEKVK